MYSSVIINVSNDLALINRRNHYLQKINKLLILFIYYLQRYEVGKPLLHINTVSDPVPGNIIYYKLNINKTVISYYVLCINN